MIHRGLIHEILRDRQHGSFLYPYYGKYSIVELTQSVLAHFGIATDRPKLPFPLCEDEKPRHVMFLFVDGLGFNHLTEQADFQPFLGLLRDRANIYPLTTVFPSTTPAALTTFHTGLTPEEHGLPEWTVYFPELDRLIETLPFRQHLTHGRDTLLSTGGEAAMLYDGPTLYQTLDAHGVTPYMFIPGEYVEGAYSQATQRGARSMAFTTGEDLFQKLAEHVRTLPSHPTYTFVYWSAVDTVEHAYGPGSREHLAALGDLSRLIETFFLAELPTKAGTEVLFLMSSDHGQTAIRNEDIIYLNEYSGLERYYARGASGRPIAPTGSPHDVFLFIEPESVEAAVALLCKELAGKALVLSTEEALRMGLFGMSLATERFRSRIGNVLIVPYEGYHVWYRHIPEMYFGLRGIHGGLARDEMLVPLVSVRLSDLLR